MPKWLEMLLVALMCVIIIVVVSLAIRVEPEPEPASTCPITEDRFQEHCDHNGWHMEKINKSFELVAELSACDRKIIGLLKERIFEHNHTQQQWPVDGLILILSTHEPPGPTDSTQIRFCFYNDELTITCGDKVNVDELSKMFFNEILKPMADIYLENGIKIEGDGNGNEH